MLPHKTTFSLLSDPHLFPVALWQVIWDCTAPKMSKERGGTSRKRRVERDHARTLIVSLKRDISEEEEEGKRTASSHGHEESSCQCEVLERPLSSTRK